MERSLVDHILFSFVLFSSIRSSATTSSPRCRFGAIVQEERMMMSTMAVNPVKYVTMQIFISAPIFFMKSQAAAPPLAVRLPLTPRNHCLAENSGHYGGFGRRLTCHNCCPASKSSPFFSSYGIFSNTSSRTRFRLLIARPGDQSFST